MKFIYKGTDGTKELKRFLSQVHNKNPKPESPPIQNPIIPITEDLSFVTDENLYKEISQYITKEHSQIENKLIFEDNVMKNSNPFLAVAVDMFCKKHYPEYRIARQVDLETNLSMFKGLYIDSGLALRNLTGNNKEQAIYLFEQLKQKGIKESNFPIWSDLRGLELNGKNFKLTDESIYSTQECLNWKSGTKYSKINNLGLPKEKDENSSRQIWTSNNALSSCCLDWDSDLYSDYSDLFDSNGVGRVVLAKLRSS